MTDPLDNPVFNALCSHDHNLGFGNSKVRCFHEQVSPFVGIKNHDENGFQDLHALLTPGRKILYANPSKMSAAVGFQLQHEIEGLQFIYKGGMREIPLDNFTGLNATHVDQMIELVRLTRPGPFGKRTIEFGSYYGIFEKGQLIAMTGQRLHVDHYSEISAVCTHPDHLGKGSATLLLQHQIGIILKSGQQPFLHVRKDNARAIALYERLGFVVSRPMNFYFMKAV
ncbi:MAG: GNAT family N-acetyltransferase [Chitinophagaceae bacterium]|nr:MAG: GNAT family N-acetyltransferase [Chitinophagaceae bacterium]